MDIKIRPVFENEISDICALEKECFGADPWDENMFRMMLESPAGNILVAKDGDKVIGFVAYGKYREKTLSDCGEIFAIYVLADYYGQKVGYELMNAAFKKLADYKKIAVWVLKGNERAIKFYERYGFRFDGTEQEIMLGTPNTELRMMYEKNNEDRI